MAKWDRKLQLTPIGEVQATHEDMGEVEEEAIVLGIMVTMEEDVVIINVMGVVVILT